MSNVVTCSCGAKVRLPEDGQNRKFRCPQCKAGIALSVEARVLSTAPAEPRQTIANCPICQSSIGVDDEIVTCPACDQVHHNECWAEIGGCGTYGCREAPEVEKESDAAPQTLSAWGDTKTCPVCGETIKAIALRCRYCKTDFDTVDPLSRRDLRRRSRRQQEAKSLQTTVIVLFGLSIIGLLAPVLIFVAPLVVIPRHQKLVKAGPIYVVLGYTAIGLSALYAILMLAFSVAS